MIFFIITLLISFLIIFINPKLISEVTKDVPSVSVAKYNKANELFFARGEEEINIFFTGQMKIIYSFISLFNSYNVDDENDKLFFLNPMNDKNDSCEKVKTEKDCLDPCKWYKNKKCVAKERIKSINKEDTYIDNETQIIKIIDTSLNNIKYKIYIIVRKNILYVLFPYGDKIKFEKEEENTIYDTIYNDIKNHTNKVILTGHSMGCCLALRCSLYLQENNKDFYDKYIYVIGSGAYNCIEKEKELIDEENKIFIFYLAELMVDSDDSYIDSYIYENNENYKLPTLFYIVDISKYTRYYLNEPSGLYKVNSINIDYDSKTHKKSNVTRSVIILNGKHFYTDRNLHQLSLYQRGIRQLN